jgi:hypothetical protein
MSGHVDVHRLNGDEEDGQGEPLPGEVDAINDTPKIDVSSGLVDNPTNKDNYEKAGIHQEKLTIITFNRKNVKPCCVLLCRGKCPDNVEHCRYIKLTISFSFNFVLVALIVFVVARNGSNDSLNRSFPPESQTQGGEECGKDNVCVQCKPEDKGHSLAASSLSSNEICCHENSESLKILAGLVSFKFLDFKLFNVSFFVCFFICFVFLCLFCFVFV